MKVSVAKVTAVKRRTWLWLFLPAAIVVVAAVALATLSRVDGIVVLGGLGTRQIELVVWMVFSAAVGGLMILIGAFVRRYRRRSVKFLGGLIITLSILGMIPVGGILFWGAIFSSSDHFVRLDGPTAGRSLMVESLTWGNTLNNVYEGDGIVYTRYSLAGFQTSGGGFNPFESGQYKITNTGGNLSLRFAEYDGGPLSTVVNIAPRSDIH